ncbi:uncharacterized protein LOC110692351 [Chenopodium quinoa]|uniref:uncharacterized protein LOC110692351 n=1 Tax=Chenopodium quinoa TaxID=63459 RepID=UPI000B77014E|nr:uncharacterized protein LOC110692351 [Chenopodium quinoa]
MVVVDRKCRGGVGNFLIGLINVSFSGPEQTWFRGNLEATFKSARLGRALSNDAWRLQFPNGALRNLPRSNSDHCPMLISTNGVAQVPQAMKPFRFQAVWMSHGKFEEFLFSNWSNSEHLISFLRKFAALLTGWNKLEFHNIFKTKLELRARLEGVKKALSKGRLSHLLKLEAVLRRELMRFLIKKRCFGFKNLTWMLFETVIETPNIFIYLLLFEGNGTV